MKINGPKSGERGEDRFIQCELELEAAFQALVWKAVEAGWDEGEACVAIASLADHHVLAMQHNDIVSEETAAARINRKEDMKGKSVMATSGKLIVLAAFDKNDEGDLVPAFDARQVDTAERAVREARLLATQHAGVVAWSRDADPSLGEYGPPEVLFQSGEIPELE